MNYVNFLNKTDIDLKELNILEELIHFAISKERIENVDFSIIFVDNKEIRELNKNYRNIDKETDVLSFALESDLSEVLGDYRMLGDVFISVEKAKEQADVYGHSFLREVAFLMIHGFLHLLGYDHMNIEDEKKMFNRQEEILDEFNIKR